VLERQELPGNQRPSLIGLPLRFHQRTNIRQRQAQIAFATGNAYGGWC
jgi:hypothetical protein